MCALDFVSGHNRFRLNHRLECSGIMQRGLCFPKLLCHHWIVRTSLDIFRQKELQEITPQSWWNVSSISCELKNEPNNCHIVFPRTMNGSENYLTFWVKVYSHLSFYLFQKILFNDAWTFTVFVFRNGVDGVLAAIPPISWDFLLFIIINLRFLNFDHFKVCSFPLTLHYCRWW